MFGAILAPSLIPKSVAARVTRVRTLEEYRLPAAIEAGIRMAKPARMGWVLGNQIAKGALDASVIPTGSLNQYHSC
jgi:hypothetical protein